MKVKSVWYCAQCGHKQSKWSGQCAGCLQWNTLSEEIEQPPTAERYTLKNREQNRPVRLNEISPQAQVRILTKMAEMDRLLGGGIVPGSLLLVGGNPGIGKSTLMLQITHAIAVQGKTVLYVCGEESVEQTFLRAQRLNISHEHILLFNETNLSRILSQVDLVQPDLLIIDSIQIVYKPEITSSPGSVTQVREAATELMQLAKSRNIATILIGHVTKSGEIAGPRVLEHLVDTVLYFEGDEQNNYRIVRAIKNRFGPTDEIALFQMAQRGLVEVSNPSQIFLEARSKDTVGSAVVPTMEGTRPILIEVQALVTPTVFPTPSRKCTGLDPNRLALLLAVMEKRLSFQLWRYDIFVSIAGGIRINETAIDLGILLAVASSMRNRILNAQTVVMGEVGLSGEIRSIRQIESRIKEAKQMGFARCLIPKKNLKGLPADLREKIAIVGIEVVDDAVNNWL